MKLKLLLLAMVLAVTGCESVGPKAGTGAVVGGLLGATAGGIIGHQSGHGLEGAGIGAVAGAVGGGLLGNSWDKQDQQAKSVNPNYVTVLSIADMGNKGVPDDVIIDEIKRTNSVYHLTSETIDYLKKNKISDKVINYMLSTSGS